jgi:hypothetical protein
MQRDHSIDADVQQTEQLEPHRELEAAEQSSDRGEEVSINGGERSHFFGVANALLAAIHPNSPELILPESLTRRETDALRLIYEAKTGRESEVKGSGEISGLERARYLNLGMIALQRVLAMARSPRFPQARAHIEEIRKRLSRLKDEIAQDQLVDDRERYARSSKKKPAKKPPESKQEDDSVKKQSELGSR